MIKPAEATHVNIIDYLALEVSHILSRCTVCKDPVSFPYPVRPMMPMPMVLNSLRTVLDIVIIIVTIYLMLAIVASSSVAVAIFIFVSLTIATVAVAVSFSPVFIIVIVSSAPVVPVFPATVVIPDAVWFIRLYTSLVLFVLLTLHLWFQLV